MNLLLRKTGGGECGLTLIELLVVIGILGSLAAVAIPAYAWIAGKGDANANLAELSNVQSAMHAMMTSHQLLVVDPNTRPTNRFDQLPTIGGATPEDTTGDGIPDNFEYLYSAYMKMGGASKPTKCYYTWDNRGNLTQVACN